MSYSSIVFNFLKHNTQQILDDLRFSKEVCIERGLQDKVNEINLAIEQNKELAYYIEQQLIDVYESESEAALMDLALYNTFNQQVAKTNAIDIEERVAK
ncbi:hypothetical protein [Mucilaginibacter sp. FT3.2]|uniref:hypothetical protein n=1 Tax=Mucilaginibacter sp. FT3.2 TaxID=2723090 RepID=UPI0016165C0F|nr:hypothetical protein [Mucilaginibacter sp. FT3.2]MBB6231712.1 hypothetical protein [Mucilaginibacter sp. FT3.2]